MRRHAKASSAGSTSGRGISLGSSVRGAFDTRGASRGADGSSAPADGRRSRSRAFALSFGAALLATLVLVAGATASKNVFTWIGTTSSGALGGQLNTPQGVAVNNTGTGGASAGDIYVADSSNNRIDVFDSSGAFKFAFGQDVVSTGTDNNGTNFEICNPNATPTPDVCKAGITSTSPAPGGEMSSPQGIAINQSTGNVFVSDQGFLRVQKFSATGTFIAAFGQDVVNAGTGDNPAASATQNLLVDATGGHFTLTFKGQTTGDLAYNVPPSGGAGPTDSVQNALQALSTVGSGNATVTGGADCTAACAITFAGALANSPQPLIVGASSSGDPLTGGTTQTATVTNTTTGSSGFEVCTTASTSCKTGVTGATAGAFASTFSGYLAVAPTGSPNAGDVLVADPGNRRVQEFDSSGNFVRAFGFDVAKAGLGNTGTTFEVCSAAAFDVCQIGAASGSGSGQFATSTPTRVAEDATGAIYTVEPTTNFRVQQFTLPSNVPTPQGAYLGATLTGTSSSNAPTDVGIGASNHLFVVKAFASGTGTPPAAVAERRILEIDPTLNSGAGGLADTHMAGAAINSVNGLAVNGASGRLLVSSTTSGHRVYMLDNPLAAPALVVNAITTKTDTTATLTGTVDPLGGNVSNCKFQYSTDQTVWTDAALPACDTFTLGGGPQAVSANVTGLVPNTHYFVRLQATRPFVSNSTVITGVQPFDTNLVPPVLSNVGAIQVGDTSARMVGTIDPRHSDTGYVFQYGTTPSLGSSTDPVSIGGGTTPIVVSQLVTGLTPDTTYYYKLVATNASGPTSSTQKTLHTRATPFPPADQGNCPNDALRQAQNSTYLPDCRAYEMVSPPDKNLGNVDKPLILQGPKAGISLDGNSVAFCTQALFGDPPGNIMQFCAPYLSRRGADGWTTESPIPPICRLDSVVGANGGDVAQVDTYLDPNFDHAVLRKAEFAGCSTPLDPAAPIPAYNLYHQDLSGDPTDPLSYNLTTPRDAGLVSGEYDSAFFADGSDDFSHLAYISLNNQTDPPDSPAPGSFSKIYEWVKQGDDGCVQAGGCLSLVSRDTSNVPFTTASDVAAVAVDFNSYWPADAVSGDGERIYFQNVLAPSGDGAGQSVCQATNCDLYLRDVAAATTYHVAASECTTDCGVDSSADAFAAATPSGDKAFFRSCAKLTDAGPPSTSCAQLGAADGIYGGPGAGALNPNVQLYRWDENAAPGHRLVDLSVDNEPGDGVGPGAAAVIGTSTDENADPAGNAAPGNTVYFAATGQIVSGAPTAPGMKIYRWQWNAGSPTVDYLATLQESGTAGDEIDWILRTKRVTPDGRYLLVNTLVPLDPVADQDSDRDIYRWDEQDGWTCLSCQLPGVPSGGGVAEAATGNGGTYSGDENMGSGESPSLIYPPTAESLHSNNLTVAMSDDGQRVFFDTPDKLVPQDTNGDAGCSVVNYPKFVRSCQDVYEWHDGTVSLVSSGTGTSPSYMIGATASGNDVAFITRQKLVGWDVDDNTDIYDARTDGGFPEPPATGAPCDGGEECHGAGTGAVATTGAGTASFQGPGNPTPKHHKAKKKPHKKAKHHRRSHKRAHRRAANHNRRAAR